MMCRLLSTNFKVSEDGVQTRPRSGVFLDPKKAWKNNAQHRRIDGAEPTVPPTSPREEGRNHRESILDVEEEKKEV